VSIEFSVGVMAILTDLPIGLAVTHNTLAALLLLGLLKLNALSGLGPANPASL
jgi:heme A synthase